MPFPQQLIAQLIKNNPQANDEEILALARGASTGASDPTTRSSTGSYEPNPLSKAWEWANQPLVAPEFGDGLLAGAGETAAKVLSTPANLASLGLAGAGAAARAGGFLGASRLARGAEAALNAPLIAEGGAIAAEGLHQGDALQAALGAGEAVLGGIGMRSALKGAGKAAQEVTQVAQTTPPTWDYEDIIRRHTAGGGSTTNPLKGDLVGQPYFAVAAYPERQAIVNQLDRESLEAYVAKNQDLLGDPGNSLGSWLDEDPGSPTAGKVYLDISRTVPDRAAAMKLGAEKNQKAIFDLGSLEEIPLEGMSARVGGVPAPEAPVPADGGLQPAPSTTLAAVAAPAGLMAAGQVAEDPETGAALEKYGALGTALASGAALGAAIRKGHVAPQKAAASRLASMMMLGVGKRERQAILKGMNPADASKVEATAAKMLEQQAAKALGKLPNLKQLLGSLSGVAEADVRWYDETSEGLQRIFGEDGPIVGKFLAATSSNATVKSNVALALKAYRQYKAGEPFQGYLPVVKLQLERIAKGEPVGGRKIDNFAKALAGDQDAVVVDRWMLRAFGLPKDAATPTQYDLIEEAVKRVAKETGQTPRQVQAGLWFATKNKAEAARGVRNEAPPFEQLIRDRLAKDDKQVSRQ